MVVPAHGKAIVKTGLSIGIPEGTYARIAPRSGLAWKNFIDTGAGVRRPTRPASRCARPAACARREDVRRPGRQVVDYDYRGEVGVILFNHSADDFNGARMRCTYTALA